MGSPIAPCMADICMNWVLNQALNNANLHQPTILCRYINDLFCILIMKRSSMIFSTHSIQFTQTLNLQKNWNTKITWLIWMFC